MVPIDLSDRITALREALPPEAAARIVPAARLRPDRGAPPLSIGIDGFDRLLGGGLLRGKLVELAGRRSGGRFATVLAALAAATRSGENAALVDLGDALDPDDAAYAGADLARVLWARPRDPKDAVYAAEVLVAAGFPLAVLDLGTAGARRIPDSAWVRLSRATRSHGTALLVSSPYPVAGTAAEAVLRLERVRARWAGDARSPRLLTAVAARFVVEKKRGEKPGRDAAAEWTFPDAVAGERSGAESRTVCALPAAAGARNAASA